MKKEKANPSSQVQSDHKTSSRDPYLKNLCRYWRLQEDQEKTPLRPASVGDIMLPSDFLHIFPSPSWTIPKLRKAENGYSKSESVRASVVCENHPSSAPLVSDKPWRICVCSWILSEEWMSYHTASKGNVPNPRDLTDINRTARIFRDIC